MGYYSSQQQQLVSSNYYGSESKESYTMYDSPPYPPVPSSSSENNKPAAKNNNKTYKYQRHQLMINGGSGSGIGSGGGGSQLGKAGARHGVMSPVSSHLLPTAFPEGTDPEVMKCFRMVDQNRNGFIDDKELQKALSSYNHRFSLKTIHLLMYLHTNNSTTRNIGPKEFMSMYYCLKNWKETFEEFDMDRNGKIDSLELRRSLTSLGFTVSPTVLDLIISKYDQSGGSKRKMGLQYDNFIEYVR
ncbi:EF-hand domain [Macleaya cordata]|uniref:EF-hand domain n=1 Tax=Macleaya cordata TaxID=56857 RepID=A0A200QXT2_MACCD|nr:EF-hand domain [Macleaya cordata]